MATYDVYARSRPAGPSRHIDGASSLRAMIVAVLGVAVLTSPILAYVAVHANLTAWEYDATRLKREKIAQAERASELRVALSEATAAERVCAAAEEMGLIQYDATQVVVVSANVKPAQEVVEVAQESTWTEKIAEAWGAAKAWMGVEEVPPHGD